MTNPLPRPVLLLLQVFIGDVKVHECAAHILMLSGRRSMVPPKLQDLDSCALLVQHGPSDPIAATHWVRQPCLHAQPCLSVQLCLQGWVDAAAACFILLECCSCFTPALMLLVCHRRACSAASVSSSCFTCAPVGRGADGVDAMA
jgi:hypothetical protein